MIRVIPIAELIENLGEQTVRLRVGEPNPDVTWDDLARMEPGLATLAEEAARVDGLDAHFCANEIWYRQFKPRLVRLVGYQARSSDPSIATCRAYDIAYRHIYDELPPCRDCWCL